MYLTDSIGDEYLTWGDEHILISSPTGSGKTTFILKKLLPQAIECNQYILYLCNRRFLDSQFEESVQNAIKKLCTDSEGIEHPEVAAEYRKKIIIHTYQYLETAKMNTHEISLTPYPSEHLKSKTSKGKNLKDLNIPLEDIKYFIYDEAHYFLADSLFNSECNYWFDRVSFYPINFPFSPCGTHIYLTATPEPLKLFFAAHCLLKTQLHGSPLPRTLFDGTYQEIYDDGMERLRLINEANRIIRTIGWDEQLQKYTLVPEENPQKAELLKQAGQIRPGRAFLERLKEIAGNLPIREYSAASSVGIYQNMKTNYFMEFKDLVPTITKTASKDNKWLIFVDKERDGIDLAARLDTLGVSVTYLSSPSLKRDCKAVEEFQNIVRCDAFQSEVLISTSIMDCGVSITDHSVKNVVVSHPNKTTFLQMLGRRRLIDQEQIHIYIRFISGKKINGIICEYRKRVQFMAAYGIRDKIKAVHDSRCDGYQMVSGVNNRQRVDVIQQSAETGYRSLLYLPNRTYIEKMPNSAQILNDQEPGKSAFVYLLHMLYEYEDVQESTMTNCDETCQANGAPKTNSVDSTYYLRYQLSWLGQTYDPYKWLGGDDTVNSLISFLDSKAEEQIIRSKTPLSGYVTTDEFSLHCMSVLQELPAPLLPASLKNCIYGERCPGLAALNRIFDELDVPFQIKSRSTTVNGARCTVWRIVRTEI